MSSLLGKTWDEVIALLKEWDELEAIYEEEECVAGTVEMYYFVDGICAYYNVY